MRGEQVAATIWYRLGDSEELVDEIVRRVAFHSIPQRRLVHPHPVPHVAGETLLIALLVAFLALMWLRQPDPLLLLGAVVVLALVAHLWTMLLAVEIDDRGVTLVRLFRREYIPRGAISGVRLFRARMPKHRHKLRVALTIDGTRQQIIDLPGNAAATLYHAIAAPLSASSSRSTER